MPVMGGNVAIIRNKQTSFRARWSLRFVDNFLSARVFVNIKTDGTASGFNLRLGFLKPNADCMSQRKSFSTKWS